MRTRSLTAWIAGCSLALVSALLTTLASSPASSAPLLVRLADGPDGPVNAIAVGADGTTYYGGEFNRWGPQTGTGAVVSLSSAAVQRQFPAVAGGSVYTSVADGVGGYFIGGSFTSVRGLPRMGLAHILPNGSVDTSFTAGFAADTATTMSGSARALALWGTKLIVGGSFSGICANGTCAGGPNNSANLAGIGLGGTVDSVFNVNGAVNALAVSGDTVYVGGEFTMIGGQTRNRLAAFAANGLFPMSANWDPGANSTVRALTVVGSSLFVGGDFTSIGGQSRNRLAEVSVASPAVVSAWDPGADSSVRAFASDGTSLYVGGDFTTLSGQSRSRLGAVSVSSSATAGSWNPGADGAVNGLTLSGSTVYAAGDFTTLGSGSRNRLGAVTTAGSLTDWNPDANGSAFTVAVSDPTVFVGGDFTMVGGIDRSRLAAVDSAGSLTGWNPGADATVHALAVGSSTVYVGGAFSTAGGQSRARIAEISSGGSATSWNPGAVGGDVAALAVDGSTVYAGGSFSSLGGSAAYLAAVGSGGSAIGWDPQLNAGVKALLFSGSTVYAGGSFTSAAGSTRNGAAAFDVSSAPSLTGFDPNASRGDVNALASSGGVVFLGGDFSTVGGWPSDHIAFVDASTGANQFVRVNLPGTATVRALAVSGSSLIAGGEFTVTFGSFTKTNLVAIDTSVPNQPRDWASGTNGIVRALAASGSAITAGGAFTNAGTSLAMTSNAYATSLAAPNLSMAPTNVLLQMVRPDGTSVIMEWTEPAYTGPYPRMGYVIEVAEGPSFSNWSAVTQLDPFACSQQGCVITGLTEGVAYRVRVRVHTFAGDGAPSIPSAWFVPVSGQAKPTAPESPMGRATTPPVAGSMLLSWTAPPYLGASGTYFKHYRAFIFDGSTMVRFCQTTGTSVASPAATECEVSNLVGGREYSMRVRAFNDLGRWSILSTTAYVRP